MKQIIPETIAQYDEGRVIERPDGFFWQPKDGGREHGPFATLLEAVQDMQYRDEETLEPGETLEEAEAELGIADRHDIDTGDADGPGTEEH